MRPLLAGCLNFRERCRHMGQREHPPRHTANALTQSPPPAGERNYRSCARSRTYFVNNEWVTVPLRSITRTQPLVCLSNLAFQGDVNCSHRRLWPSRTIYRKKTRKQNVVVSFAKTTEPNHWSYFSSHSAGIAERSCYLHERWNY